MNGKNISRRKLDLNDLDNVVRDAESLLASGYERAGSWDLAQVCGHVGDWMSYPMDGFPTPPLPIRAMLGMMRVTIGKRKLRQMIETRSMPDNNPTLRETIPASGGDEAAAVRRLREVSERLRDHPGPFYPSPLFGELDHESLVTLNVIHATHHLNFLAPKE